MEMNVNNMIYIGIGITCIFFLRDLKNNKRESNMPMYAVNIGVIGTFLGITLGLRGFNVDNIDASIPVLLEGMKTAFYTSLAGMGASIVMKVLIGIKNDRKSEEEDNLDYSDGIEVTKALVEEIRQLNKISTDNQTNLNAIFLEMKEENHAHSREMMEQLTSFKMELISKDDELIGEFKQLSAKMVEMSSKSIIEALNQVIKDFNTNLTEQFGENFKELNRAVSKLLDWQENYKQYIEVATDNLNGVIKSIHTIKESYVEVVQQSKAFDHVSQMLGVTLGEAAVAHEELSMVTQTFVNVSNEAVQVIPHIKDSFDVFRDYTLDIINEGKETTNRYTKESLEILGKNICAHTEKVEEIIDKSSSAVELQFKDYTDKFSYLLEELRRVIPEINDEIVKANNRFNDALKAFEKEMGNAIKMNVESVKSQITSIETINTTLSKSIGDHCNMIEKTTQKTTSEIESTIKGIVENTNSVINDRINTLEKSLENELNVALKSLGTNLVQISRKFADDYTPLAEKLKEVVNIVREV